MRHTLKTFDAHRNENQNKLVEREKSAHENVQKLEDAFVREDVQNVPRLWVDDGQPVDLILQQRVDGFKQTGKWQQKRVPLSQQTATVQYIYTDTMCQKAHAVCINVFILFLHTLPA